MGTPNAMYPVWEPALALRRVASATSDYRICLPRLVRRDGFVVLGAAGPKDHGAVGWRVEPCHDMATLIL